MEESYKGDIRSQLRARLKKEIIQNNIYGVDIEEGAIEIARLRFWLSLVIDLDKPEPLPNFDYKFMQGNSLLESYEGIDLSNLSAMKKKRKGDVSCDLFGKVEGVEKDTIYLSDAMFGFDLQKAIKDYFAINDHIEKQEQKAEIDEYLKCVICHTLSVKAVELNGTISNLKAVDNLKPKQQKVLEETEAEYHRLQDIIKNFHSAICDKFFLWHLWFKDVFDKGGFDIVIGNPPYVRLGGTLKETYEPHKYCVPKDGKQKNKVEIEEAHSFQFKTFTGDGDIYCLFYEWGYELLKDKGHLCYITSNRWLKVDYGEKLRDFLASNTNPLILIDFDGIQVFKDAKVDTNILLFAKSTNSDKTFCAVGNKDAVQMLNAIKGTLSSKVQYFLNTYTCNHYTYQNFNSSEIWIVLSPMQLRIKKQIASKGISLKDKRWNIRVNYGIKTGCNPAFIIDSVKRDNILSDCRTAAEKNKTEELIVRIVQGCDIKRYEYEWADNWLINTHNGVKQKKQIILPRIDVTEYPAVKKYLNVYLDKLKARQDQGYTPYNLRNCAYINDFNQPKIAWNVIGAAKEFAIVEGGIYVQNSIHFMVGKHLDYICAILNSKLMQWLLSLIVGSAVGGNACNADNVTNLPIAKYDSNSQPIADIANKILSAKKQNPTANTTNYERQIDALVYLLYGITSYEELLEIEGNSTSALEMLILIHIHQRPNSPQTSIQTSIQSAYPTIPSSDIQAAISYGQEKERCRGGKR